MSDRVDGLRQALAATPENHALRLILAETLEAEGRADEALDEYETLLRRGRLPPESLLDVGWLALAAERVEFARSCAAGASAAGLVEGVAELRSALDDRLSDEDVVRLVEVSGADDAPEAADLSALQPEETITFAEIGGLADVKKTIHRTIVLPFQRPDLYARYRRRAGGGILLYGPPGVGKTMLARATAGECGLPFFNVRIEAVLDPYLGVSERNLHAAFEHARASSPCVLFLDELDAIAFARRKHHGGAGRALVDQLLQELDAIGSENAGLLVLAATNAPWDVDEGLKRPGRFDRMIFVPPPDADARSRILELHVGSRPAASPDYVRLARATALFSGADLRAVVERAVDSVIDRALESGQEIPVTTDDLSRAAAEVRPSTVDWLQTAANYVEFANQGGRYDDVAAYLRSPEAKAARR